MLQEETFCAVNRSRKTNQHFTWALMGINEPTQEDASKSNRYFHHLLLMSSIVMLVVACLLNSPKRGQPQDVQGYHDLLSGWDIYDNGNKSGLDEGNCNIKKVQYISNEEFLFEYAFEKPVIFVNVTDNTDFQKLCTRNALMEKYGNNTITISTANTHSYRKVQMTLEQYLSNDMKPQPLDKLGKDTLYFFGNNNYSEWDDLFSSYLQPPFSLPGKTAVYSFGIAGPGTGVPFHFHGPGFAEVVHGAKRWFLYPPGEPPVFDPDENIFSWVLHKYPTLKSDERPFECTIKPTEILYFPDKWWHATLNLKSSVFISTFLG